MNIISVKLSGRPLRISAAGECGYIGSQYDYYAAKLMFERPPQFEEDSLLLFFSDGKSIFAPVNIGTKNEFAISDFFTQNTVLKLEAAFERNAVIVEHSDVYTFF